MAQDAPGPIQRLAAFGLRITSALSFVAPLLTRLTIGLSFHGTGHGKLSDLSKPTQLFIDRGIPFPHAQAIFIGALEFVGGLCLILGLGTRVFAALLACTMIVALATGDGRAIPEKFPGDLTDITSYAYLLFLLWLVFYGPGPLSIDKLLSKWLKLDQKPPSQSPGNP
jgi:putative oxidoreductase